MHRKGDSSFSFHLAPSSQPLFSGKKSTSWLAVSKTTAFCGNTVPLYPWTSWAAGKMSFIFMCGNSQSAACLLHCVTLQLRKAWLWLFPAPAVLAEVKCVLFNEEYMNCTWGSRETLKANYSLYYWYRNTSNKVECKHYRQDQDIRVGCHFNQNEIIQFQPFHVLLKASMGGSTLEISKRMELQDLVKPDAPVNLTIHNMSNNQLQLTWATTYPKAKCLEHAVKYKSNKDTDWMEISVNGDVFSLPSVDYKKFYTFYVRSKVNKYCGRTQLWSEWSVPVVWGSNSTSKSTVHWFWIHTVLIPIASCVILLVLVILLVRMERVWVILMPRIPNPSKNFDELFITHNGNFQEWAGVPKDVVESFKPNYSENICYVSELPPKDSYDPLWESSNPPPSVMPSASPAPGEHSPYKNSYGRV
ncbi:PREDICTED: cytokine receptor common subunit gamma isoform X2 [Lepidothrix coronata]|uniref:Cytokine receptor common subunit gamma isoform X2 n=1 Tax=Lepidothrix coronata TaxID=321398 RepID=A0A6J0HKN7_9PASS|nr:PREDICTED: cytokine receptor common subunit gamma isoform X2 [Lepidothrix coronata]